MLENERIDYIRHLKEDFDMCRFVLNEYPRLTENQYYDITGKLEIIYSEIKELEKDDEKC